MLRYFYIHFYTFLLTLIMNNKNYKKAHIKRKGNFHIFIIHLSSPGVIIFIISNYLLVWIDRDIVTLITKRNNKREL